MKFLKWLKNIKCNHDYKIKSMYTIHTAKSGTKIVCIYKCKKCGKTIEV